MTEEALKERKEGLLALMEDPSYVPMKLKELSMLLNVPRERREELKEVLDALIADGKIVLSKRGKDVYKRQGRSRTIRKGLDFLGFDS